RSRSDVDSMSQVALSETMLSVMVAYQGLQRLKAQRSVGGNPYHDEHGLFTSGPSGGHAEFHKRPRKKGHKFKQGALDRLQAKWDKYPVKTWPAIKDRKTGHSYHVKVTK